MSAATAELGGDGSACSSDVQKRLNAGRAFLQAPIAAKSQPVSSPGVRWGILTKAKLNRAIRELGSNMQLTAEGFYVPT